MIHFDETAEFEGTAAGEHGIDHLRHGIVGYTVRSRLEARALFDKLGEARGISRCIGSILYKPALKRRRGSYRSDGAVITLHGTPHLATLLHEFAHHIVYTDFVNKVDYRKRLPKPHGREFKAALRWCYVAAETISGLPIARLIAEAAAIKVAPRFRPGQVVRVKGGGSRKFRLLRKKRTQWVAVSNGTEYTIREEGIISE